VYQKFFLCLTFIFISTLFAQENQRFYGNFVGIENYIEMQKSSSIITKYCVEKKFEKALRVAEKFIKSDRNVGFGYKEKFKIGIWKKDVSLIKESLNELTDKYFFYIFDYNQFFNYLYRIFDKNLKSEVRNLIEQFFEKREEFLKDKLKFNVNNKAIYKELTLLNYETGDEGDFTTYLKKVLQYDYRFSNNFSSKGKKIDSNCIKEAKKDYLNELKNWENTIEQKMETLLRLTSEMKEKNASLDFAPIEDWSNHAASYLPDIIESKNKQEFYEILAEIVTKIGENHTRFYFSDDIRNAYSGCGLETIYAGDKFLVKKVTNNNLKAKIEPGDEIISIGGTPVSDYVETNKSRYPFVSYYYFKPQIHAKYQIGKRLLYGKKNSTVDIEFKKPDGTKYTEKLIRNGYKIKGPAQSEEKKFIEMKIYNNNIYYFRIKRFWGSVYVDFYKMIKDINTSEVNGVIFDIRDNPGGNSSYGNQIFSHFIEKPLNIYYYSYRPIKSPLNSISGYGYMSLIKGGVPIFPAKRKNIKCPVVLIINPSTGSSSEGFSFSFKYHKIGKFVGLPTSGGTGNPFTLYLAGGASVRICLNVNLYFSWKGIQPDYWVDFTPEDLAKGKDPQLEKALEILAKE